VPTSLRNSAFRVRWAVPTLQKFCQLALQARFCCRDILANRFYSRICSNQFTIRTENSAEAIYIENLYQLLAVNFI
jgi:hypothetical protein